MDRDLDGLPGEGPNHHRLHTIVELKGFFSILDGQESPDSGLQLSHDSLAFQDLRSLH